MTLAVTDGALDHGMSRARAAVGRAAEAEARLQQALGGRCEPDWFTVDDQLAGYVMPALVGDDRPVPAPISATVRCGSLRQGWIPRIRAALRLSVGGG